MITKTVWPLALAGLGARAHASCHRDFALVLHALLRREVLPGPAHELMRRLPADPTGLSGLGICRLREQVLVGGAVAAAGLPVGAHAAPGLSGGGDVLLGAGLAPVDGVDLLVRVPVDGGAALLVCPPRLRLRLCLNRGGGLIECVVLIPVRRVAELVDDVLLRRRRAVDVLV